MEATPLPRVAVHVNDTLVAVFYGDQAVRRGEDLCGDIATTLDESLREDVSLSVSDDQCADCGEMFSHEARVGTDNGWVCPSCGGDPKED